jgi:glyoxylase-like metal-dependent hydrolase (beta-lactamase superfamily II)
MRIRQRLHAFLWNDVFYNNCNTYFIDASTRVLIDPGHVDHFDHVKEGLDDLGVSLDDIDLVIATHAHPDHIEAVRLFADRPARIAMHPMAWQIVESFGPMIDPGMNIDLLRPDMFLEEGGGGGFDELLVLHAPGHSPGSIVLFWEKEKALFSGDLVFRDGVGRTDIPGGDTVRLKQSILRAARLDVTCLLPGHGDIVSGRSEVASNFQRVQGFY